MFDRTASTSVRLSVEWARLRRCPVALATADRWAIVPDGVDDLGRVVAAVGGDGDVSRAADVRLRRLVALADRDELAARTVVERLRPGLLAVARRRRESTAFEELLGAAWIAVRTYDGSRRNGFIAASLLSDAEWHAFRRHERRKSNDDLPLLDRDVFVAPETIPAEAELAALLDEARAAGVAAGDLDLVTMLLRNPSVEDVAAQLEVTSRTVRNRRARVAARLREVALAA